MPFTPFHLGPGLLLKAAAPNRISFTAFAATQVAVDCEPLYNLLRQQWPVHRQLHSMAGGTAVGLVVAAATVAGRPVLNRILGRVASPDSESRPLLSAESSGAGAAIGGVVGGVSHSILDGIMHSDVHPLWPVSAANPLFALVGLGAVQVGCVLAAVAGVACLWLGQTRRRLVV